MFPHSLTSKYLTQVKPVNLHTAKNLVNNMTRKCLCETKLLYFFSSPNFKYAVQLHMPHFGICLKHSEQNDNVYWGAACYYCPYKAKMLKKLSKNCTNICQNNWKRTLVQRKNHFDVRRNISKGGKKVLCGFFFTET